jgi:hypothetical protein
MANWLKLWLNYGSFEGKRFISEDYIRNAISTKAYRWDSTSKERSG